MKSDNSIQTSKQQDELINRLEEIRRRRLEGTEGTDAGSKAKTSKTTTQRRKRNEKPKPSSETNQKNVQEPPKQRNQRISTPSMRDRMQSRKPIRQIKKQAPKKRTTTEGNPLLKQLSSSEDLAQTIVLSEILSKPVALRKRRL